MKMHIARSFVLGALALSIAGCAGAADAAPSEQVGNAEAVAQSTQADSKCVNVLSSVRNQIPHVGPAYGWVNVVLSIHRQDPNWGVQYASGYFNGSSTSTTLKGFGWEYFSIRSTANGSQPFSAPDAESLDWTIDANGVLKIHNRSWSFDMDPINFGCIGNVLTTYQPGLGVVSLTFTGYGGPARL